MSIHETTIKDLYIEPRFLLNIKKSIDATFYLVKVLHCLGLCRQPEGFDWILRDFKKKLINRLLNRRIMNE